MSPGPSIGNKPLRERPASFVGSGEIRTFKNAVGGVNIRDKLKPYSWCQLGKVDIPALRIDRARYGSQPKHKMQMLYRVGCRPLIRRTVIPLTEPYMRAPHTAPEDHQHL